MKLIISSALIILSILLFSCKDTVEYTNKKCKRMINQQVMTSSILCSDTYRNINVSPTFDDCMKYLPMDLMLMYSDCTTFKSE